MHADAVAATWPLAGRREELVFLRRALDESAGGAVIAGAAGVGKSRLAAELAAGVGDRPVLRIVASASLRAVPLGAFAPVLPPGLSRGSRAPAETLRLVADHLLARPGGPPLVWIDDAHCLDDLSAGLALQLAVGRRAFVLATLRSDEPAPDAIRRLWRDGHARRLEIQALGPADTAVLLERVLGGAVDGGTRQRMWDASRGNLLYLRELVRIGVASGALAQRGDLWIWQGNLRVSSELRDLIAERLAGLDAGAHAAFESIAFAAPLSFDTAARLGVAEQLVGLERAGLVQVEASEAPPSIRLAHPLFGEVLRASVAPLRAAAIARVHAEALAASGEDPLRLAIAQAEGLVPADAADLLEGTRRARALSDHALATRLARAAVAAGGGARAVVELAECLFWEQRHAELIELLEAHPLADADPADRVAAAVHRASSLYWGFGRDEEAIAVLRAAVASAPAHPAAGQATGQCAFILANAARPAEAIAAAREVLDDPTSGERARVYAYSAVALALAIAGRFDEAHAEVARGFPLALAMRDEMPATGGGMVLGSCIAWFFGGDFAALERIVGGLYQRSAEIGDPFLGIWAHFLARSDLMRGRLADAERRAAEAVALLELHDPGLVLPWALAVRAQVAAQRGDVERSRALVRDLDRTPLHMASCAIDLEMARAWCDAASGDLAAARRRAGSIARRLCDGGSLALAAFAIHDLARLGAAPEAVALLPAVESHVGGPLVVAWARQVRALAASDATALDAAGAELDSLGVALDAAESFAAAAVAHRSAGLRDAAARSAARAIECAAACVGARTPLLDGIRSDPAAALSPRERHVAQRAAAGATRREIAEDLGLSVRTVSNHLNHVYAKLGVADRASLAALLTSPELESGAAAESGAQGHRRAT